MKLQRLKRILSEDKKWLSSYVNKASDKNVKDAVNMMKRSKDMSDDEFSRENARINRRTARIQKTLPKVKLESFNLMEANISHFSHLGLDPNNPEHKDMVDAYNNGLNAKENKISAKPNQIKTFDQLKNTVAPHVAAMQQKRKEDDEDKEAFANKEAELVHHDPSTGVKVFKVRSGKGCAAVGGDTKWCTADRATGEDAFKEYDPEEKHSYVIHTPEKGNLSKIGIIGVKPKQPHISGLGGNFQDKGNNTVSDEDWDKVRKKYNLDSIKSLHGIRGLKHPEMEIEDKKRKQETLKTLKNKKLDGLSLFDMAENSFHPEIHKAILNHENTDSDVMDAVIDNSSHPETHKAILNHPKVDEMHMEKISEKSHDPEVHKILSKHKNSTDKTLLNLIMKSDDPEVHREVSKHPNAYSGTLRELLSISKDPETIRSIAKHRNIENSTRNEALEKLKELGHNTDQQSNPYHVESFLSAYKRVIK